MALAIFVVAGLLLAAMLRACRHEEGSAGARTMPPSSSAVERPTSAGRVGTKGDEEVPLRRSAQVAADSLCLQRLTKERAEQLLVRTSYVSSYNEELRIPNWVAWHLTAEHTEGPFSRSSEFFEDEDVSLPRATPADYRGSGWSRGHMCPAGDNKWSRQAMYDTFLLTNICPQHANLNSGLWNSIEMDCRRWARRWGDVYVVCGPVLMNREHETIGANKVVVPEVFFKVVLCLQGEPKGMGFIVRNTDGTHKRDLYYNSIDQVERIAGIDFFPALPDDIEEAVEAQVDREAWR
ncbi:MAG: DNA/RNA non-specific endonuclease [Alloprevotella sp.]|nr:DNA/RNA non-specific endonuclease [Alloprevotella sp.]